MPAYVYTNFKDKRVSKHLTNTQHLSGFKILQHPKHWNSHMYVQIYTHTVHTFTFTHTHSPTHSTHTHFSIPMNTSHSLHTPILTFFTAVLGLHCPITHTSPSLPRTTTHTSPSPCTPTVTVLLPPHPHSLTPLPLPAPPHSQFSSPHPHTHTHISSPCTPTLTVLLPPAPHTLLPHSHSNTHSSFTAVFGLHRAMATALPFSCSSSTRLRKEWY